MHQSTNRVVFIRIVVKVGSARFRSIRKMNGDDCDCDQSGYRAVTIAVEKARGTKRDASLSLSGKGRRDGRCSRSREVD